MGDIESLLEEYYAIKANGIQPGIDGHIIHTGKGKLLFKKTYLSLERIKFINEAKEHLYNNGFFNIDRYIKSSDNNPGVDCKEYRIILSQMPQGRECDFESLEDTLLAVKSLALLHNASKNFDYKNINADRSLLGKMSIQYEKRLNELKRLKNYAMRKKEGFDYIYLNNVDYYLKTGYECYRVINSSVYSDLVEREKTEKGFCHHDFCHRNIVIEGNRVSIKGFEYCCRDIRVFDLADIIRRRMKRCKCPFEDIVKIIYAYTTEAFLDSYELKTLKAILNFPYKFWKIANKFYNSKRCWSENIYIRKMKELVKDREHDEFIMGKYDQHFL